MGRPPFYCTPLLPHPEAATQEPPAFWPPQLNSSYPEGLFHIVAAIQWRERKKQKQKHNKTKPNKQTKPREKNHHKKNHTKTQKKQTTVGLISLPCRSVQQRQKIQEAALCYYGGGLEVHLFVKMASAQADVSSQALGRAN